MKMNTNGLAMMLHDHVKRRVSTATYAEIVGEIAGALYDIYPGFMPGPFIAAAGAGEPELGHTKVQRVLAALRQHTSVE